MDQLKLGIILILATELQKKGMTTEEIMNMPVYIGNDDELNGIHTGWYVQVVDPSNEDDADLIELIDEDYGNIKIEGKSILIS